MNPGEVWWGQIGTSLRFIESVTNCLRDCRSTVLQVPQQIPWKTVFYSAIDLRRTAYCGERRLVRLDWTEGMEPGEFILDELCSSRTKADYWPGQSYAAYLGQKEDILICDYYVWITGVHTKADIDKWSCFIGEYVQAAHLLPRAAVFIIEYDGQPAVSETPSVPVLHYDVASYDCRVFALEISSTLNNAELQNYQAELAYSISGSDPEFCFALLEAGEKFVREPVISAMSIAQSHQSSCGVRFKQISETQAESSVWEAALVQLFPILERFRMDIVSQYEASFLAELPISNAYGEKITDPKDLEIGMIYSLAVKKLIFSSENGKKVNLCRRVRNYLAHNKTVPYNEVCAIYAINEQLQQSMHNDN